MRIEELVGELLEQNQMLLEQNGKLLEALGIYLRRANPEIDSSIDPKGATEMLSAVLEGRETHENPARIVMTSPDGPK